MTTIGLDPHKRESQLCIAHEDGTIQERRIARPCEHPLFYVQRSMAAYRLSSMRPRHGPTCRLLAS